MFYDAPQMPKLTMTPAGLSDDSTLELLRRIESGEVSAADALALFRQNEVVAIGNATIDIGRQSRCRFGEVIYGEGKPADLIVAIARQQLARDQSVLVTRVNNYQTAALRAAFAAATHHPISRTVRIPASATESLPAAAARVVVVTAGSTDEPVAAEATETLTWMNVANESIRDVGVAGPQRLLAVVPQLRRAAAIVVVAGMEGALASIVGGHVACPVIAVPTSVGYGTCFGGITAMLGMMSSCAANVSVVGIDAGFKAGYVAGLIATQLNDLQADFASRASDE